LGLRPSYPTHSIHGEDVGINLERFIDTLYEGLDGLVYGASKDPGNSWTQKYFQWPDERPYLLKWIEKFYPIVDIYLSPSVYSDNRAVRDSWKATNYVWCEVDNPGFAPDWDSIRHPDILVQSSVFGNYHAYWRVAPGLSRDSIEGINRGLMHMVKGADSSGWDCTQILRPPETLNHKPGKNCEVTLLVLNQNAPFLEFDPAEFPTPPAEIDYPVDNLPDPNSVLVKYMDKPGALDFLVDGMERGKRSSALFRLANALAAVRAEKEEIFAVVLEVDNTTIHKFTGRTDQHRRISEIVTLAITKHRGSITIDPEAFKALYTGNAPEEPEVEEEVISVFLPLTQITEIEREVEFIWDGLLTENGMLMLVGSPGIGKTQFTMYTLMRMALGLPFLNAETHIDGPVGLLSLEQDSYGLGYIAKRQVKLWTPEQLEYLDKKILMVGVDQQMDVNSMSDIKKVEKQIEINNFRGLAFDTFSSLTYDTLVDERVVKQVIGWLDHLRKKFNMFIWLIHHDRKGSGPSSTPVGINEPFGGRYGTARMDTILALREDEKQKLHLDVVKARYSGLQKSTFNLVRTPELGFTHEITSEVQEIGGISITNPNIKPGPGV